MRFTGRKILPSVHEARSLHGLVRWLLLLMPMAACLGSLASIAGPITLFRLLVIALLICVFCQPRTAVNGSKLAGAAMLLAGVWGLSAVGLLLLRGGNEYAPSELASLTFGLLLLVGVANIRNSVDVFDALVTGWLLAYVLAAYFATREIVWSQTLANYYIQNEPDPIAAGFGVASVFGNPNSYAFFLVASIVMLAAGIARARTRPSRLAYVLSLIVLPVFLAATDSRTGILIALVLTAVVVMYLLRVKLLTVAGTAATLIVGSGALFMALSVAQIVSQGRSKLVDGVESAIASVFMEQSYVSRVRLVRNGLDFLSETWMVGLGPGGFEERMTQGDRRFDTGHLINPHNGIIEILSQYGVIVTVAFSAFLVGAACAGVVGLRGTTPYGGSLGLTPVLLVLVIPAAATMNSSFLEPSVTWLVLTAVLAAGIAASVPQVSPEMGASQDNERRPRESSNAVCLRSA